MATLDRPLPMACWEEETDRDYSLVYNFMSSLLNAELMAVRQSLYEKGLQLKQSHSCLCNVPAEKTLRDKDGSKDELHSHKVVFDFAAVHRERALNAGKLNKDTGRRWRRKNFIKKKRNWKSFIRDTDRRQSAREEMFLVHIDCFDLVYPERASKAKQRLWRKFNKKNKGFKQFYRW